MIASLAGLAAGAAFAKAISALLASSGVRLPAAALVLGWRTVAISLGAGVAVPVAASLVPALRAMRIPPIRAIRAAAGDPAGRHPRGALAAGAVLAGAGASTLAVAAAASSMPVTPRMLLLAGRVLMLSTGLAGASRRAVGPLAAVIGKPLRPFTGAVGELARENATRNPGRTAATAAALTVGVALIAFVTVLAQGLRQSTGASIRSQVSAGYVISPQQDLLAPAVQHALRAAGITSASVRAGTVHVLGTNQVMTAVAPADIARFYHFTWAGSSSPASLTALGGSGVLLASGFAQAHHLGPGAGLTAQTTAGATVVWWSWASTRRRSSRRCSAR
jgi:putative ABC transport system permease protein